jgi:YfiH family protein
MPIRSVNELNFFQFETLTKLPVEHAIFTRQGGVSPPPWNSLNVGGTVGDDLDRVRTNQTRAFHAVNRDIKSLFDVWQVHSADHVYAQQPRDGKPYVKADVILTQNPDVTLFMRFADCVPIMLIDVSKNAIALAHAGWLGTVRGAARSAVIALKEQFGSSGEDVYAGLGPSIGPDHYEVGEEVLARYVEAYPHRGDKDFIRRDDKLFLDLWSANEAQLRAEGVNQIEISRVCTACDVKHWYSHRAEKGQTGRFGALLGLRR